tara:strand:+ start:581 stop:787 length:207 start_codon:yes stop_codon:yes gene_type:complete
MIFRKIVITALGYAARNPAIQQRVKKIAAKAAVKAKPALLKGSRVAGEKYRHLKQEVKKGVEDFKKEK